MLELHQSQDELPSSLRPASLQVARFRSALDWMLAHPLWQDRLAAALTALDLKGQRQGIAHTRALRTLAIEHKASLIRHALANGLPTPSHAEAKRLARLWGVTGYRPRSDFQRPSLKVWQALEKSVLLRLAARHESYKAAQSSLYAAYQEIPLACALAECRKPAHREDACQEARLALLDAIDRIDPEQCFQAYARHWIKRRVQNFLIQQKLPVKAPVNLLSKSLRGHRDGNPLLAKAIREGVVQLDNPNAPQPLPFEELRAHSDHEPDSASIASDDLSHVTAALSQLTDKQRKVIELRFGFQTETAPQTLSQIAQLTGISRQQVFQREKRALQKLAATLDAFQSERRNLPAGASSY